MIFIEALNRPKTLPNKDTTITRDKLRVKRSVRDSVDLSSDANEVKEIHLDSTQKEALTAPVSVFANLIEHVFNHIFNSSISILSPEELNLEEKEWQLFLQVPPSAPASPPPSSSYKAPEIRKRPQSRQLTFHIPVKPQYGNPIDVTVLLSAHKGSPEIPALFSSLPKENTLATLTTPYSPEFLAQQITDYHVFIDQDGEEDQLSTLYSLGPKRDAMPLLTDEISKELVGLRIWYARKNILRPIILGDTEIGLLYVGHYRPLIGTQGSHYEQLQDNKKLLTKA